jgi:hypothetical protein
VNAKIIALLPRGQVHEAPAGVFRRFGVHVKSRGSLRPGRKSGAARKPCSHYVAIVLPYYPAQMSFTQDGDPLWLCPKKSCGNAEPVPPFFP